MGPYTDAIVALNNAEQRSHDYRRELGRAAQGNANPAELKRRRAEWLAAAVDAKVAGDRANRAAKEAKPS